jgi:hypothetical protein
MMLLLAAVPALLAVGCVARGAPPAHEAPADTHLGADTLPRRLPVDIRPGVAGAVQWSGSRGQRWSLGTNGAPLGYDVDEAWVLAGGWSVEGRRRVMRDGAEVCALEHQIGSVAVDGDTLWITGAAVASHAPGPSRCEVLSDSRNTWSATALTDRVAFQSKTGVTLRTRSQQDVCRRKVRVKDMVGSPDGRHLVLLGNHGLAVWDENCTVVSGTRHTGEAIGFVSPDRLVIAARDASLTVLSWPELALVSQGPPQPTVRWELAQGPEGPAFVGEGWVFDPLTQRHTRLPDDALVLARYGVVVGHSEGRLVAADLALRSLQDLGPALAGRPQLAVVDAASGDLALYGGGEVVRRDAGGAVHRWPVDRVPTALVLHRDGGVGYETQADPRERWLRPGVPEAERQPFVARVQEIALPGGGRLPLVAGDASDTYLVVAAEVPTQVVRARTLTRVGPGIPRWFETVAIDPAGQLLVGRADGAWWAHEVATGRLLWTLAAERDEHAVSVFPGFVALGEGHHGRLVDRVTGEVRWRLQTVTPKVRGGPWEFRAVATDLGTWPGATTATRSPAPAWPKGNLALATPAAGPPVMTPPTAARIAEALSATGPLVWMPARVQQALCLEPDTAESANVRTWLAAHCDGTAAAGPAWAQLADASLRLPPVPEPLEPGARLAKALASLEIPMDGRPVALVLGTAPDLPEEPPPGVRVVRVHNGKGDWSVKTPWVAATPALERRLGLSGAQPALLVGADGRVLARGRHSEILASAPRAGLEDAHPLPAPQAELAWTRSAPARVRRVEVLDSGEVLVATDRSSARLASDGALMATTDVGAADPEGARADLRSGPSAPAGWSLADPSREQAPSPASRWFEVPGGWCEDGGSCQRASPMDRFALDDTRFHVRGRTLWRHAAGPIWLAGQRGVAQAVPLSDSWALVQLGSEAGPWVLVDDRGRDRFTLAPAAVVGATPQWIVLANDTWIGAFAVPPAR